VLTRSVLTRSGAAVAVAATGLLLGGWAADYPELVALGLAGAAALVLALAWVVRRPDVTATRRIHPQRVAEGEPAFGVLTVTNARRRRTPPVLADEVVGGLRVAVALPSLRPGASHETAYPLPTARRGRYPIEPLVIGHSDPLRLFRLGRRCGERSVLYVHPKVRAIAAASARGPQELEGRTSSYSAQGGVAFHSLRGYQPADDWRMIHWKSTARSGALMVRHNVVPDEPRHLVVLDTAAPGYTDDSFEEAVRAAASLCVAFARGGSALALHTTGGRSVPEQPAARGGADPTPALDALAEAARTRDDAGLAALSQLVPAGPGVVLVVVTGEPDPAHLAVLPSIRPRFGSVSLVQVSEGAARPRQRLPGIGAVSVRTSEDLAAVWDQVAAS
jgi:uncharacterized protein (DUF58 family)